MEETSPFSLNRPPFSEPCAADARLFLLLKGGAKYECDRGLADFIIRLWHCLYDFRCKVGFMAVDVLRSRNIDLRIGALRGLKRG